MLSILSFTENLPYAYKKQCILSQVRHKPYQSFKYVMHYGYSGIS